MESCKYFNTCSAPLCPLDEESIECGIWYADEEICKLLTVPGWVKKQRRIKKKDIQNEAGFFNVEMLKSSFSVTGGLKGINADLPEKETPAAVKKWLKAHPGREITKEQKAKLRDRIASVRAAKKGRLSNESVQKEGDLLTVTGYPK